MNVPGRASRRATRVAVLACATLALALSATVLGDDGFAPVQSSQADDPRESGGPAGSVTSASPLNWWAIPWRARTVLRRLAAQRQARITRCLVIEHDSYVTYEIHGRRRLGLFRTEDIILTRFTESRGDAEIRGQHRSLNDRLTQLGEAIGVK